MTTGAVADAPRNPHAGVPFDAGDAVVAAALEDARALALLCSLVHMTGEPSWVRGPIRPRAASSNEIQGGLLADELAELRRLALPAIASYRDGGCVPHSLPPDLLNTGAHLS